MTTTEEIRLLDGWIDTMERQLCGLRNQYRKADLRAEIQRARARRRELLGLCPKEAA